MEEVIAGKPVRLRSDIRDLPQALFNFRSVRQRSENRGWKITNLPQLCNLSEALNDYQRL